MVARPRLEQGSGNWRLSYWYRHIPDEPLLQKTADKSIRASITPGVHIPPPTHDEQVADAEAEKQSRIEQANAYMNSKQWPGKAAIGRLKGDDLVQYNLWLDYLDALEAVDTSTAPDITWPTPPGS